MSRGASPPRAILAAGALVHVLAAGAAAEPRLPVDEAEVLERVAPADDPEERAARALRARLDKAPEDASVRLDLARLYLARGWRESEPRFFGRARGALGPLWTEPAPSAEALVLRAAIHRAIHDFGASLNDLDAAIAEDPGRAQAHLDRATTLLALGEPREAALACAAAHRFAPGLPSLTCLSAAASLAGAAAEASDSLREALEAAPEAGSPARVWALVVLAEIALRRGDAVSAERRFLEALALDPTDLQARLSLADLRLLDGRPEAASEILASAPPTEGVLLRRALAAKARGAAEADALQLELAARIGAAALRGDEAHLRDAARFRLEIEGDAETALDLARRNWARQRGPEDARLLIEAAAAARQPEAALPALDWIEDTRLEDAALARARARLRSDG